MTNDCVGSMGKIFGIAKNLPRDFNTETLVM